MVLWPIDHIPIEEWAGRKIGAARAPKNRATECYSVMRKAGAIRGGAGLDLPSRRGQTSSRRWPGGADVLAFIGGGLSALTIVPMRKVGGCKGWCQTQSFFSEEADLI